MSSKTRASRPVGSSLKSKVSQDGSNLLKDFVEFDDLGVGTESPQGLDLPEVVDLLNGVEVVLHALDGHILASFDALRLEDLRESSLSLFANKSVF